MFEGTYTAIVTPFGRNGRIDFDRFKALLAMQIRAGIDGVVPMGTTGESPTLDFDEHKKVIDFTVKTCRGRMKVIAGTGANSTAEAVELTRYAIDVGADATLQVTPYYNKPNQDGLVRHFSAIADLGLPVMLYNVPGRTSREISLDTVRKLAKHPKIIAIKEAGGSVDRVSALVRSCTIEVLSGDDSLTLPMMAVGARGVVSVASNVAPSAVAIMVKLAGRGDFLEARKLHMKYHRLFCDLFIDTNPIPVKAAMAMMGLLDEVYRLPLCSMSKEHKKTLRECLKELKLL